MKRTPFAHILILIAFLINTFGPLPIAQAQELRLPAPGTMVRLSPAFNPPILKGIKVNPDNPFRFDFILDVGDGSKPSLQQESIKLIKYFLASLTIPEKDLWVNLSPYEKDRIIPQSFGLTEMGRDLLAEDYMLKQITASLIYPEGEIGRKFWKRIYAEAAKKFGTTNIPVNTFNKVWIVPEKAVVYENAKAWTAYVVGSRLKVMLEEDYLAMSKSLMPTRGHVPEGAVSPSRNNRSTSGSASALGSQIVREIVIPELTKEVNEDKNFAQLRQVYNSLILATWYKKKIKDSILAQVYNDKNKIQGLSVQDIYQRYLKAFQKGVYNYIKEEQDPVTQKTLPRKYFSGGVVLGLTLEDAAMNTNLSSARTTLQIEHSSKGIPDHGGDGLFEVDGVISVARQNQTIVKNENNDQIDNAAASLESHLRLQQNDDADIHKAVGMLHHYPKIVFEIGGGNGDVALAIAGKNQEIGVISTDRYNTIYPKEPTAEMRKYYRYAKVWEARNLKAQRVNLDNLVILRSGMDVLAKLPDNSIDYILLVNPMALVLDSIFGETVRRKLKAGGQIVIKPLLQFSSYQETDHVPSNLPFKVLGPEFLGVNINSTADFESESTEANVYALTKEDKDAGLIGAKPDEAMRSQTRLKAIVDSGIEVWELPYQRIDFQEMGVNINASIGDESELNISSAVAEVMANALDQHTGPIKVVVYRNGAKAGIRVTNKGHINYDMLRNKLMGYAENEKLRRLPNGFFVVLSDSVVDMQKHGELPFNLASSEVVSLPEAKKKFGNKNPEDLLWVYGLSVGKSAAEGHIGGAGIGLVRAKQNIENAQGRVLIKNDGNEVTFDLVFDAEGNRTKQGKEPQRGGIDLTPGNMNLETKMDSRFRENDNGGIKFHLDPALLAQLQNAPGFVPVIINIRPMTDLKGFLGLTGENIQTSG